MADYISREAAKQKIRDSFSDLAHRCEINAILNSIPAADVVARDCYDRILAENDTMREQLAQIGKKPGDSMDDVRPVVRGEWWPAKDGYYGHVMCSGCHKIESHKTDFCPDCGADMREPNLDTTKGDNHD